MVSPIQQETLKAIKKHWSQDYLFIYFRWFSASKNINQQCSWEKEKKATLADTLKTLNSFFFPSKIKKQAEDNGVQ